MADDSTSSGSHGGLAVFFGVTSIVFIGTTAFSLFMWNKERKKNIQTNTANQNSATTTGAASGSGTSGNGSATGSGTAATGTTAQPSSGTQTKK